MSENKTDKTAAEQLKPYCFKPGQSGNPAGRPKGSRSKLSEAFLADLYEDWQANGTSVIERVRADKPDAYMKVIASILPKELNVKVDPLEDMSDAELDSYIKQLASAISLEVRAGESAASERAPRTKKSTGEVPPVH